MLIRGARVFTPLEPRPLPERTARRTPQPRQKPHVSGADAGRTRGGTPSEGPGAGTARIGSGSGDNAAPPSAYLTSIRAPCAASGWEVMTEEPPGRNPWRKRGGGPSAGSWLIGPGRGRGGIRAQTWETLPGPCFGARGHRVCKHAESGFWSPGRAGETSFERWRRRGWGPSSVKYRSQWTRHRTDPRSSCCWPCLGGGQGRDPVRLFPGFPCARGTRPVGVVSSSVTCFQLNMTAKNKK